MKDSHKNGTNESRSVAKERDLFKYVNDLFYSSEADMSNLIMKSWSLQLQWRQ